MDDCEIDDVRQQNEFRGISFSEFKKTDVKKELLKSLYGSKIEPACYWSSELICAGHYYDLWEIIIQFYSKNIHIGNPKLVIYLELRINDFKSLVNSGYLGQEIRLRNNIKMRKLFCEVICVLCNSKKSNSYTEVKIKKEDFDMTLMLERFKAPSVKYADEVFKPEDPKELFIAINELAYNLSSETKNTFNCCYWIEWILEFESICKRRKENFKCERRVFANVESKLQMDIIWLIWELILNESKKHSPIAQKIINSTLNIFVLKYTPGCHKKRKMLIYFVILILTTSYSLDEEMIKEKEKIEFIKTKINNIYKQIKKNEYSPKTDYLYKNIKNNNLDDTIRKLEKMNSFESGFIPRLDDID